MRPTLLLALLATCLLLACPWARAEDEPPAQPAVAPLVFDLAAIAPEDGSHPEGWAAATTTIPDAAPTTGSLLALAREADSTLANMDARCLPMTAGEQHGVAAWMLVEGDSPALRAKLAEVATAKGWETTYAGHPSVVLLTWATDEAAATAIHTWQVDVAVRGLCERGFKIVSSAGEAFDRESAERAFLRGRAMIDAAGRTEPRAGIYHALMGRLLGQANPQQALEHDRKALAKDAPVPAPDRWIVLAAFNAGQALLVGGDASDLNEAVRLLQRGIEAEQHAENHFMRFGNRYNLACAYARLGDKDKAFAELEESLRFLKTAWEEEKARTFTGGSELAYPDHYKHAKDVDTDLAPLRADERWTALMAKYDPAAKPAAAKDDEKDDEKDK
ncbi:MAG: hypothetical protein O2894_04370 [Planctomycetota bacterium]|nr:hypothetical protein [Planctomycetota bacterium]